MIINDNKYSITLRNVLHCAAKEFLDQGRFATAVKAYGLEIEGAFVWHRFCFSLLLYNRFSLLLSNRFPIDYAPLYLFHSPLICSL
jgi:hypothetical protein